MIRGAFKLRVDWIQLVQSHQELRGDDGGGELVPAQAVAVQEKFESKLLKPYYHI